MFLQSLTFSYPWKFLSGIIDSRVKGTFGEFQCCFDGFLRSICGIIFTSVKSRLHAFLLGQKKYCFRVHNFKLKRAAILDKILRKK